MSNTASAAKPVSIGGGVYVGDVGTTLPTDTTTTLASGFAALGYISTDGVTHSLNVTTTEHKVWGGTVVAVTREGSVEKIKFKVVDIESVEAWGLAYGEATGTLSTGITIKSKEDGTRPTKSYVVDMLLKNNIRKRLVIPCGMVSAVGDVVYKDNELIGVELEVTAMADASGYTSYEYIKSAAASSGNSGSGGSSGGSENTGGGS